jgi:uncharacterized paraquat-inducible protein A
MKRRANSLHYCSQCRMTTRHVETATASTCTRCGAEKPVTRVVRSPEPRSQPLELTDDGTWN